MWTTAFSSVRPGTTSANPRPPLRAEKTLIKLFLKGTAFSDRDDLIGPRLKGHGFSRRDGLIEYGLQRAWLHSLLKNSIASGLEGAHL